MADGIGTWLERQGLAFLAAMFEENELDLDTVRDLAESDLRELGIAMGPRKKLLRAIRALNEAADAAVEPAPAASSRPSPAAERRQLTILFCDLVGSTALSRAVDAEDLRELMRRYQDAAAGALSRYGGHVAKYLGDGVLAYFGWPQAFEDQAERAIRAAREAVAAVAEIATPDGERLQARAGIASGEVIVGDLIGAAGADQQAVIGETPNLAARLQAIAEPGQVVIGAATRRLVGGVFALTDLGPQSLKGFEDTVPAWRVDGEGGAQSRFDAAQSGAMASLVGREPERAMLAERWELARAGEGQIVLLSGEAGIGKSRVVRAMQEEIAAEAHFRLHYQCSPHHTNSAFHPIVQRLERAAGFVANESAEARLDKIEALLRATSDDLLALAPLFATLMSLPGDARYGPLALQPKQVRDRIFDGLLQQLVGLARRRPVLFVLEDAHWIDPTTEAFLAETLPRLADARVLVLITHRPDYAPSWPDLPNQIVLNLGRLGRAQALRLIQSIGGERLAADTCEQIIARAEGVPLFVEELTRHVVEGEDGPSAGGVPATLQASLMARLDRLGDAKEIAQLGAALGRDFSYDLIAAVSQAGGERLAEALQRIVEAGLLLRRGTARTARYMFKHALVQDEAYASLLRDRRRQIHADIAHAIETAFADRAEAEPELLAHHWHNAGDPDRAIDYWGKAGRRALEQFANIEAAAHLNRALETVGERPRTDTRRDTEIELLSNLGVALMSSLGFNAPAVIEAYERTRELCQQAGDKAGLFAANWGLWMAKQTGMRLAEAGELSETLLRLAAQGTDTDHILQSQHAAWTTCFSRGDLAQTRQHAHEGRDLYDIEAHRSHAFRYGGHDPGVCARNFGAWAEWIMGEPRTAHELQQEGLEIGRALGHPFSLGMALCHSALISRFLDRPAQARAYAEEARALAREYRFAGAMWVAHSAVIEAWSFAREGEESEAMSRIRAALAAKAPPMYRPSYLACQAEICLRFGHLREAATALEEGLALVARSGERWWEPELHRLRAELYRANGAAPAQVEAGFRAAMDLSRAMGARMLELRAASGLAQVFADAMRRDEARDLLRPVLAGLDGAVDAPEWRGARALLDALE